MKSFPRTRFAPSPTGRLHLGHAYAAWFAWQAGGGKMVLRIEDIDRDRCRPEYEEGIFEDLEWLELWQEGDETHRQTDNHASHHLALEKLKSRGLLYPCFCTRREILEQASRIASAPHGPDGLVYPGTCRGLSEREAEERMAAGDPHVLRLDVKKALVGTGRLTWNDQEAGEQVATPEIFGDVVLARKFAQISYHLCCVVDDAAQAIGLVTRGRDLFSSTHVHRLLQASLELPTPDYLHHALVVDAEEQRLAKRADARSIQALREQGLSAKEVLLAARQSLELSRHLDGG